MEFDVISPPMSERRKETRFLTNMPALLLDSTSQALKEPLDAKIIDISKSGLKIEVWHDAPIGSRFSMSLHSDDDDSLCLGEVIWKRETTTGMIYGLRIVHWTYLTPRLASQLHQASNATTRASSIIEPMESAWSGPVESSRRSSRFL
jgi:hypothetical protein